MLNLVNSTTDKLQLVTDAAQDVDVVACYADLAGTTLTLGRQVTAITTATTTDIVATPAASTVRNVKTLHIRNKDTGAVTVTVVLDANGTDYEIHKSVLAAGKSVDYVEGRGFHDPDDPDTVYQPLDADLSTIASLSPGTGAVLRWGAGSAWTAPAVPACRVYHSTDQALTTGVFTALTFNSESFDTDTCHDTGTNPTRLTCKTAGIYLVAAEVQVEAGGGTERAFRLYANGTTIVSNVSYDPAIRNFHTSAIYDFDVNEYVEALVYHDVGSDLDAQNVGVSSPVLSWMRVG